MKSKKTIAAGAPDPAFKTRKTYDYRPRVSSSKAVPRCGKRSRPNKKQTNESSSANSNILNTNKLKNILKVLVDKATSNDDEVVLLQQGGSETEKSRTSVTNSGHKIFLEENVQKIRKGLAQDKKDKPTVKNSTPPPACNILNTNKLKRILTVLADQTASTDNQAVLHGSTSENIDPVITGHEIFLAENLKKIKNGLKRQTGSGTKADPAEADDSDCCVIYSSNNDSKMEIAGDHGSSTNVEKAKVDGDEHRERSRHQPKAKTGSSSCPKVPGIARRPNIFDKEKLRKILTGIKTTVKAGSTKTQNRSHTEVPTIKQLKLTRAVESAVPDINELDCGVESTSSRTSISSAPYLLGNLSAVSRENIVPKKSKMKAKLSLREQMVERLNTARFRFINEMLYTSTGSEAMKFFKGNPESFKMYQAGYRGQVSKWPVNPVTLVMSHLVKQPRNKVIADLGCGDATLAQSLPHKVHSFDLVALNKSVTVCNIEKVPLQTASVDVVVFCLSLMGNNTSTCILEANRILRNEGLLLIAEVESRFSGVNGDTLDRFIAKMKRLGFTLSNKRSKKDQRLRKLTVRNMNAATMDLAMEMATKSKMAPLVPSIGCIRGVLGVSAHLCRIVTFVFGNNKMTSRCAVLSSRGCQS